MIKRFINSINRDIFRSTQPTLSFSDLTTTNQNQFSNYILKLANSKTTGFQGLLLNYNRPIYYIKYLNNSLFYGFDYIEYNYNTWKAFGYFLGGLFFAGITFGGLYVYLQYQKFLELRQKMDDLDQELTKTCEELIVMVV
jgi:hypothetical protein